MLNPSQQQAVRITDGPVRIIAGAGTGKTHTLVSRIAYLVKEKNIRPEKILALTFTNKAAHEINERLIKRGLPSVNAMTFHSLAAGLLRKFWNPDFAIITQKGQEEILREVIEPGEPEKLKEIIQGLEAMRHKVALPEQKLDENRLREILQKYKTQLDAKNAVDFTGLLETLVKIWEERPETLLRCQDLYQYILVDEYQDVNAIQIKIMTKLADLNRNICVVGDPDQTIYSWRGARAETMTEFERIYPDAVPVALTKNYRNPPAILKGAEKLISHNIGRLKKPLVPAVEKKEAITFWESGSDDQQMEIIFHLLEKYLGSHSGMHMADLLDAGKNEDFRRFSDIAFLYRTKAQGRKLFEQLIRRGYPCQMSVQESFWNQKEIIDFLEAIENLSKWMDIETGQKFSKWITEKINKFIEAENLTKTKISLLSQLIPHAVVFDDLPILDALGRLLDESRTEQEADNLIQSDKINLLTLHAAKGLEFPIVFIVGLEEGNIPHKKLKDDPYWLAEERRLLYVGMTRATDELHLFYSKKTDSAELAPSRFLKEISHENLIPGKLPEVKIQQIKRQEIKKAQMKLF